MPLTTSPDSGSPWQHPLIRPLSRRRLILSSLAGAGTLALAPAIGSLPASATTAAAQASTPVATGDADAIELLAKASQVMAGLDTFHFEIETLSGGETSMGINLESVVGDVRRPMDFQAEIEAKVPFGTIKVRAVGLDGVFSIQNPLSTDNAWMTLSADNELFALVNPDIILLLAVQAVQDAKIDGEEKIDGVQTTLVTGQIDFQEIASTLGNGNEGSEVASQLATTPVDVLIWIDGDTRVHAIELDGALLAIDSDTSSRMISFSAFNEPVEIAGPE
ncbi:MAG TPA: LppX_LprAFG lipoprotein [Thermomicrobiales bacterium]|nr:LppX_LprAFG lipoprotein [Thermomicrobiales bacterium]